MPNGPCRPVANTLFARALLSPSPARSTRTRPGPDSATKMSPFGATTRARGSSRPEANSSAVNPGGTFGLAPGGRDTARGKLLAEWVA